MTVEKDIAEIWSSSSQAIRREILLAGDPEFNKNTLKFWTKIQSYARLATGIKEVAKQGLKNLGY